MNMKSLKILRRLHDCDILDIERLGFEYIEIYEAIAELEALQQPKSCEGCVWDSEYGCTVMMVCKRHKSLLDRYEAKDKQ